MFLLPTVLVAILLLLFFIYTKLVYFTLRGPIPGLAPQFFFGNLLQSGLLQGRESLPTIYQSFKARYGDIFQFWLGSTRIIVLGNIDDIQHVYNHRYIYDVGTIFSEKIGLLFPNALITNTGQC